MLRLMLAALLISPLALAQTTYVWTDEQGRKHYSDQPPPPSLQTDQKQFNPGTADAVPPYAVRQAASRHPVVLHTGEACALCDQARKLLAARGVPFTEKKVASKEELEKLNEIFAGNGIVPSIEVGAQRQAGFGEARWQALLDEAGYPRSLQGLSR